MFYASLETQLPLFQFVSHWFLSFISESLHDIKTQIRD